MDISWHVNNMVHVVHVHIIIIITIDLYDILTLPCGKLIVAFPHKEYSGRRICPGSILVVPGLLRQLAITGS